MPKLTKTLIDRTAPEATEIWLRDSLVPGFSARVLPSGQKTFNVQFKIGKKTQRRSLGFCGVMDLDAARDQARQILESVKKTGAIGNALITKSSPTVRELAKEHQAIHCPPKIKASTAETYRIYWESHIVPALGDREVRSLTRHDVLKFHSSLKSIYSANRSVKLLFQAIKQMNTWGGVWPRIENPAANIKLFKESSSERILEPEKARELFTELDRRVTADPMNFTAWMIMILQMTGLRTGEWRLTPWSWVDLSKGEMKLPMTKSGKKRTVMLDPAVVDVLKQIPRIEGSKWIFPGQDLTKPIGKPKGQWKSIKKVCGIDPKFRIHDIRHTFASTALVRAKLSIKEVSELLGHSSISITSRYLHLLTDETKAASSKATGAVISIVRKA